MAIIGLCILVGMKLAVDYMNQEINRYEEEFDKEEDEVDNKKNNSWI